MANIIHCRQAVLGGAGGGWGEGGGGGQERGYLYGLRPMLAAVHQGACTVCHCVRVHMLQQDLSHGTQQRLKAGLLPLQAVHVHVEVRYDAH